MTFDTLGLIAREARKLGYRGDAQQRRNYAYSDVWMASGGTRSVPLAAFTQTPPSYRSAALAVAEASQAEASGLVESHRALGAPLFFVIEGETVSSWQVRAKEPPRFLERFSVKQLPETFDRHSEEWAPDVIHRAKSIGRVDSTYQRDFVDVGLIPAIEGEIHTKLDRLILEAMANVGNVNSDEAMRLLFRGVFRLLAAKILTDRMNERAERWNADSVADVLSKMGDFYLRGKDTQIWPAATLASLGPVWASFRAGFNVANISADDLAYVYESTLVTRAARAEFGTHSTPRHIADYVLDRFRLWEFGTTPPNVYEPFAGAGVFLGSALRQMRDGLPPEWSDKARHDLLIRHIGGAEIDPFACEVAQLSLILADYPNANGWQIEEADLFKNGALAQRLEGADVILCNPPFKSFTPEDRRAYPEASAINGSKAVFALETALQARPKMLGFVVPTTLLVDRRYRTQRRLLERWYRDIELVSLPDGVFNVSQVESALLIARDHREIGDEQRIRSSAVYDSDKRAFSVSRKASHTTEKVRQWGTSDDGSLWIPPLNKVWTALADRKQLGTLVQGHWGLRWHGGQKKTPRSHDRPGPNRRPGYMDSSALHQFVLDEPRFLDVKPETIMAGGNFAWDDHKILCNAGRVGRGYWRLAAAVDQRGNRASQQLIAFWPNENAKGVDLDAIVALINGPVINAFVAEHSFDRRFRIRTLEQAPLPANIPDRLGDLSRAYAAAARQEVTDPKALAALLAEIDALILDAYALSNDLKRDLQAAIGDHTRPIIGLATRRSRPRKQGKSGTIATPRLPLFSGLDGVEVDVGEELGEELSPEIATRQLRSFAHPIPIAEWAGEVLQAPELVGRAVIQPNRLNNWISRRRVISFKNAQGVEVYPIEQFEHGKPLDGLTEIVVTIGDPRTAWLWLRSPHVLLDRRSPLEILRTGRIETLRSIIARDFQ
jgi:hypothetical protein